MKAYKITIFAVLLPMACIAEDTDGDGLTDDTELKIGTSITSKDSDGDGGSDYDEVRLKCDPTNSKHKIIKLEPWENPKIGFPSRKATISYDGKIVETTDILTTLPNLYVYDLERWKQEKKRKNEMREFAESVKARMEERERYLALSPKYDEIKKLRAENSKLRELYYANKTQYNQEAWEKVRIPLVELEKIEYEGMKARATYLPYARKNRVEELEDKVEELENKIDDLRDR